MPDTRMSAPGDGLEASSGPRPPGVPLWVKAFGVLVLVLLVLLAVMLLNGGSHGPGRHTSSGQFPGNADVAVVSRSDFAL
ncbi:MAG: hypothetical protein ACR2FV_00235 [Ornithinimicrobium sp.]|uniref:hypothetical protein n=1 Tax=Ornithinimicrobium sp. TaxID=1977084 RepID=UPI003D9B2F76